MYGNYCLRHDLWTGKISYRIPLSISQISIIFFPLTLIVVTVSTIYAVIDYRSATEAVAYKQRESAKTTSRALALPLWNFDIETAENIVAGLIVDQDDFCGTY